MFGLEATGQDKPAGEGHDVDRDPTVGGFHDLSSTDVHGYVLTRVGRKDEITGLHL
jgi:hypothetical protein